ncbi:LOW QUALITY PROTEIN: parathyroid hormone 4 [Pangasianodon hypophthalmus]|uniref:LOW QUALITY PROTEIN: parathyroid hormone 4 n=1 Tax=Pangasianodon hypophthalmus TaxID=310915 RepID=UPI000EFDB639|nr:LOW QUALITY PROTEIN: parathyroid hormone 4 [Pangasianodon hypophthalmus]
MVQKGQSCRLLISCMLFIVLTVAHSQENERRAVTEHQLMHDRGRSIQSLKRLIWLSSAIERLHTAETRSLSSSLSSFSNNDDDEGNDEDSSRFPPVRDSSVHQGALELLLRDMYRAQPPSGRKQPSIH